MTISMFFVLFLVLLVSLTKELKLLVKNPSLLVPSVVFLLSTMLFKFVGGYFPSNDYFSQSILLSHFSASFLISVVLSGWNAYLVFSTIKGISTNIFKGLFDIKKWFLLLFLIELICSSFAIAMHFLIYNYLTNNTAEIVSICFTFVFNIVTIGIIPLIFYKQHIEIFNELPTIFYTSFKLSKAYFLIVTLQMLFLGTITITSDFTQYKIYVSWIGNNLSVTNWYSVFVGDSKIIPEPVIYLACFLVSLLMNLLVQIRIARTINNTI
jgi:hypothetical protein